MRERLHSEILMHSPVLWRAYTCCLGTREATAMEPSGGSNAVGRRGIRYRAELRYRHPSQRTSRTWTSYGMGERVSLIRGPWLPASQLP
jgi:hypothetical protein